MRHCSPAMIGTILAPTSTAEKLAMPRAGKLLAIATNSRPNAVVRQHGVVSKVDRQLVGESSRLIVKRVGALRKKSAVQVDVQVSPVTGGHDEEPGIKVPSTPRTEPPGFF